MTEEQVRVLVIDDSASVCLVLQRMLEEAGYEVVTATNGQEALDKMYQLNAGVVLLDILMPGMSGMEVMQQITTNWPETCVIMVTGVVDTQIAVDAMKLGAYDYITKPFMRAEVAQKVQEAVSKWRHQLQEKR